MNPFEYKGGQLKPLDEPIPSEIPLEGEEGKGTWGDWIEEEEEGALGSSTDLSGYGAAHGS